MNLSGKITKRLAVTGRTLVLAVYAVFALFPLIWMLILTLKADADMYTTRFIFQPTLDNYKAVLLRNDYLKAFMDNAIVSGFAVLISMLVGTPAAYALARYQFKWKEDFAFLILSFKFAPEILVVMPLYMIYQALGLYDTYFGLIWVYQLITMPMIIWVVRGYFEDISVEVEQAAQLDGYAWYAIFFKIMVPLIKPGLVASALLAFIFAWNNFTFSLILSEFEIETITVSILKYIGSDTAHYGQVAVAASVAALPEIILAVLIQKHLVRGLSFGAVKG